MSQQERISVNPDIYMMSLLDVTGKGSTKELLNQLNAALKEIGLEDNTLIQDSIRLAFTLHEGQERTYEDYVNHVLRVPLRLIKQLKIIDPVVIAAAILHDSLEDQSGKLITLQSPELVVPVDPVIKRAMGYTALKYLTTKRGSNDVAELVRDVSIPPISPKPTGQAKIREYLGYTATIMSAGDPRSRVIKHGDKIDNSHTRPGLEDPLKRAELDMKQIGAYPLHIAGIKQADSLIVGKTRQEAIQIFEYLESEARARMEAYNKNTSPTSSDFLRSA